MFKNIILIKAFLSSLIASEEKYASEKVEKRIIIYAQNYILFLYNKYSFYENIQYFQKIYINCIFNRNIKDFVFFRPV